MLVTMQLYVFVRNLDYPQ